MFPVLGKFSGRSDEGLEELFLDGVAFVEKFGMPLDAEEKLFVWCFDGFNNTIGRDSRGDEGRWNVFYRLMVRTVDLNGCFAGNAPK